MAIRSLMFPIKSKKSQLKEFTYALLTFIAVFILFKIFSNFNFKIVLIVIFVLLCMLFIKKTKFLFYMFIISLPFTDLYWIFRIGFHFQLNYLFFMLVLTSFFYNKIRNKDYSFIVTSIDKPLFLFLLVATISIFQTRYVGNDPLIIYDTFRNYPWIKGFIGIMFLVFMFLVYYLTINIVSNKKIFKKIIILLMLTSVIVSSYALLGVLLKLTTPFLFANQISPMVGIGLRIKSVFREPLFFANYLLTIIPVVYCLLISKTKYINKYFLIITSFILTLALILSVSRGAWFGYIVFLIVFAIIYRKRLNEVLYKKISKMSSYLFKRFVKVLSIKNIFKASFFILLLFTVLFALNPQIFNVVTSETVVTNETYTTLKTVTKHLTIPITSIFDPSSSKFWSTRIRILSMEYALDGFRQHPLLGIGYSNYLFYSGFKVYEGLFLGAVNIAEVNNYPLKILAEMGLIGFITLLWLFLSIIKSFLSSIAHEKDNTKKTLLIGYFLSFVAISAHLLFFSYTTITYLWVTLAMMMSLCKTRKVYLKKI